MTSDPEGCTDCGDDGPPNPPPMFDDATMDASSRAAVRIARRWGNVPDTMSNDEAFASGLLTIIAVQIALAILQEVLTNCLANQRNAAWTRVRAFVGERRPAARLADEMRLAWMADRWMGRLGHPRERGDVVALRAAIIDEAGDITPEEFAAIHGEVLFLTM